MSEQQALDAEEFDEFAKDNWGEDEMYPADASLWVEDWDDDAVTLLTRPLTRSWCLRLTLRASSQVDDEFAKKLKEELAKAATETKPASPPPPS